MNDSPQVAPESGRTPLLRDEATVAARALIIAVAVAAALWFAMRISVVTVSLFFGFALASLLWPLVKQLRRFMPHALAVLLSVLLALAVLGGAVWFAASRLAKAWPELSGAVSGGLASLEDQVQQAGLSLPDGAVEQLQARAGELLSGAGSAAVASLGAVGTFGSIVLLTIFATVFSLIGGTDLARSTIGLLRPEWRDGGWEALRAMTGTARAWLGASTATGIVDGLLIGLGMWALGVPLAVPVGMLTFFAGFIPTIGAIAAGAVAVVVALFSGGLTTALWTLLLVVVVQQVEGNVLQPLLMSRAMDFAPLLTLVLTTAGGILFGLVGMILAVPTAGFLTSAVRAWRGETDGDTPPVDDDPVGEGSDREPVDAA